MKNLIFILIFIPLFIPQILFADIICEDTKVNIEALENVPVDVDLSRLLEDTRGDLFQLGYEGNLCGHEQLDNKKQDFCFIGHDKDAAYAVFNYFRIIYRKQRSIHLVHVEFVNDDLNSIDLYFKINDKSKRYSMKRCPSDHTGWNR